LNLSLFPSMISDRRLHCGRFSKIMQGSNLSCDTIDPPARLCVGRVEPGFLAICRQGAHRALEVPPATWKFRSARLPDGSFAALPSPGGSWRVRPRFLGAAVCSWSKRHGYVHKS
jgi:hypothetical protein